MLHIGQVMWVSVARLIILLINKNGMDISVSYIISLKEHCQAIFLWQSMEKAENVLVDKISLQKFSGIVFLNIVKDFVRIIKTTIQEI